MARTAGRKPILTLTRVDHRHEIVANFKLEQTWDVVCVCEVEGKEGEGRGGPGIVQEIRRWSMCASCLRPGIATPSELSGGKQYIKVVGSFLLHSFGSGTDGYAIDFG